MLILQDYELNISLDTEINAGELDKKLIDSTIEAASKIINSDLIAAKEKQIEDTQKKHTPEYQFIFQKIELGILDIFY